MSCILLSSVPYDEQGDRYDCFNAILFLVLGLSLLSGERTLLFKFPPYLELPQISLLFSSPLSSEKVIRHESARHGVPTYCYENQHFVPIILTFYTRLYKCIQGTYVYTRI